ncbi:MAG: glycosyltransferase [Candidatus Glassbacteria bacterium]
MKEALCIFSWKTVWSLGTGSGSPDFFHSLTALGRAFDRVTLIYPAGSDRLMREQLPEGIEAVGFRCPPAGWRFTLPGLAGAGAAAWPLRLAVFALDWLLRIIGYAAFTLCAVRAAVGAGGRGPALVAAYGCQAVPAGRIVSARLGAPLVVRLFGVSLGVKSYSTPVLAAQFEEALAFRVRARRWIVSDDGSGPGDAAVRLGVKPERLALLRPAVDRQEIHRADDNERKEYRRQLGLSDNAKVILRVSRFWPQQRIDRLIRALPDRLGDGTPVAAVIVGEGVQREYLERLARLGKPSVVFTGALPNAGLAGHYRNCDLYVATADRTNLSHSVLEALCHGLPVAALDTGRTADLIRDGVNGRLVAPGDDRRLKAMIEETLSDLEILAGLGRGALATADEFIPAVAARVEAEVELYRSAAGENIT